MSGTNTTNRAPVALMHTRKTPKTIHDVVKLMRWLSQSYAGGFHPDDDPKDIVYGPECEPVFPTKKDRKNYRRLSTAAFEICAREDVDIYALAMVGSPVDYEDNRCIWHKGECLDWTHDHTSKIQARRVTQGMRIKLYGEVFNVSDSIGEGYKLRCIQYDTTDSGGYAWRGRLMLNSRTKVTVYGGNFTVKGA